MMDLWLLARTHLQELLEEAEQARLARQVRRNKKSGLMASAPLR
jgi:hypothetical protein